MAHRAGLPAVPLRAVRLRAVFDDKKPVTLSGIITKVDWLNPHAHLYVNVPNANTVVSWAIELESPIDLGKSGWNKDSVKMGDEITVRGIAARDSRALGIGGRDSTVVVSKL